MHRLILRLSIIHLCTVMGVVSQSTSAAPPAPVLSKMKPGIQMLFSGDPDTTEAGCAQDGPRAGTGGDSGKMHNELLECDNWHFGADDWGQASFLQGAFTLGASPFSDDGAWQCTGNVHHPDSGFAGSPCANSTIRVVPTYKNTAAPGLYQGHAMSEAEDWVIRFDFKVETVPGDTFGGDKLFEPQSLTGGDILTITGAGDTRAAAYSPRTTNSFLHGEPNHYKVRYGPAPEGSDGPSSEFIIPGQLFQGTFTLHYKASNQRLDLWLGNDKLLENFESYTGDYDFNRTQLGGGGMTFENALYDNILMGVPATGGTCGAQGPGPRTPGDFNCDDLVDVADLGIIGANFSMTQVTYMNGDANLDNVVDVADLGMVGANWSSAQGMIMAQDLGRESLKILVPEPKTTTVMAIYLVLASFKDRRAKTPSPPNQPLTCHHV